MQIPSYSLRLSNWGDDLPGAYPGVKYHHIYHTFTTRETACRSYVYNSTLPENRPLEKEIPTGNHHFRVRAVCFREGISAQMSTILYGCF